MSLDAQPIQLTKRGRIVIEPDGTVLVSDFDGDRTTCRETCVLACLWAIQHLSAEVTKDIERPGGSELVVEATVPEWATELQNDGDRASWLADKIVALGDYAKEAAGLLRRWPTQASRPVTAPKADLPFDPGYVHAYLKAALVSVEPEGCTDPQAAYFMDWLEQIGNVGGPRPSLVTNIGCAAHGLAHPCEACAAELPYRKLLEHWTHESHLQTFEDRERFRKSATQLLGGVGVRVVRSCPATRPECPHGCTKHDCDALAAAGVPASATTDAQREFAALSEPVRRALVGATTAIMNGVHARAYIEHNPDRWLCFQFNSWDEVDAALRAVKAWDSAGYRAKDDAAGVGGHDA
jgi:hypothetical protein